jgi:hypothetical protein
VTSSGCSNKYSWLPRSPWRATRPRNENTNRKKNTSRQWSSHTFNLNLLSFRNGRISLDTMHTTIGTKKMNADYNNCRRRRKVKKKEFHSIHTLWWNPRR